MKMIMSFETYAILLNGVPGKVFHSRRWARQGDPLSSLLFVLAAYLLQSIVISAMQNGVLSLPLPERCGTDFPIIQYADDTLLIIEDDPRQLLALKALLNTFVELTTRSQRYIL
jgi:hypothetical protein